MPRPRRKQTSRRQVSTLTKKDCSINSTLMDVDVDSKIIDDDNLKVKMWKAQVKDKMKDALGKLDEMRKEALESFELYYHNLLMGMNKDVLNMPLDINNEGFRLMILSMSGNEMCEKEENENFSRSSLSPVTVKRRSRSANTIKHVSRNTRMRSTSVDVYKTPKGRIRLSSIMSHKKYTVMKPAKTTKSGLNVKRIMKPDEVAISTCGSPLYVASSVIGAPHVNIPLPGGVVLNIEPEEPIGPVEFPGLDSKTKSQLKILCEQLKKLF